VDTADRAGWTALMYACRAGHRAVAAQLLRASASINARNDDGPPPSITP
jgi:ankyrin repeat protein